MYNRLKLERNVTKNIKKYTNTTDNTRNLHNKPKTNFFLIVVFRYIFMHKL